MPQSEQHLQSYQRLISPSSLTFQDTIRSPSVDGEGETLLQASWWDPWENPLKHTRFNRTEKDGTEKTNPSAALEIKAQQPSYTGSAKLIAKGRMVSKQTSSKHPNQKIRIKIRKSNLLDVQTSKRFHLGKLP